MIDYSGLQSLAASLVQRYGQSVTFTRTSGSIDPVTGVDSRTTTTIKTSGILRRYPDSLIDGTRIQSTDRELVIRADEITPTTEDMVTVNGKTFAIEEVQTSDPAGTPLAYFVRVRR